ncbi:MAG: hypothetical protein M5U28_01325 [Sandaracinaceae bacterium]|nr:hypothetical protein [Sandaracinaceae bacterium]
MTVGAVPVMACSPTCASVGPSCSVTRPSVARARAPLGPNASAQLAPSMRASSRPSRASKSSVAWAVPTATRAPSGEAATA